MGDKVIKAGLISDAQPIEQGSGNRFVTGNQLGKADIVAEHIADRLRWEVGVGGAGHEPFFPENHRNERKRLQRCVHLTVGGYLVDVVNQIQDQAAPCVAGNNIRILRRTGHEVDQVAVPGELPVAQPL